MRLKSNFKHALKVESRSRRPPFVHRLHPRMSIVDSLVWCQRTQGSRRDHPHPSACVVCKTIIFTKSFSHTEPLFKQLHLLKVKDIFEIQCLKFWYKFVNNKLPNYFRNMFTYNHELHEIETRNHDRLHLYPTRTSGARNVLRHHIPELLNKFPPHLVERFKTHSLYSVSHHIKCYLIDLYSYDCDEIDCYICNNNWERKIGDSVTWVL